MDSISDGWFLEPEPEPKPEKHYSLYKIHIRIEDGLTLVLVCNKKQYYEAMEIRKAFNPDV